MNYTKLLSNYLKLFVLTGFIILPSCHETSEDEQALPPSELLVSNYKLADLVCISTVTSIESHDTLFTDAGDPGYIRYLFKTNLLNTLKGEIKNGSALRFYMTAEYNENFISYWQEQNQLLVFLKMSPELSEYYAIEAGVIPYSRQLAKKIPGLFTGAENP